MDKKTKITYKQKEILNLSDIEHFNQATVELKESTRNIFLHLRDCEQILLQRKICPLPRLYTYPDMMQTQARLQNLDFLQALKFSGYVTNARKLLQKYLRNNYDFLSCISLINRKENGIGDILSPADDIMPNVKIHNFADMKDQPSPTMSIRNHLGIFLGKQISYYKNMQHNCYTAIEPDTSITSSNKPLYLSIYQIPESLLLFTLFDGRDFGHCHSQKNKDKLPPHKKERSFSEFSYQIALKKFQEYTSETDANCPLALSTIFRCDNIFLFYKLDHLLHYFKLYLSDYFLDTLIHKFKLSYRQVTKLEETIINNIFKDEKFILAGLKSDYLDFMLPFDIFYQYTIFDPIPGLSQISLQFEDVLSNIKKKVIDIWETGFHLQAEFSFLENGDLSIASNENTLMEHIIENPFYQYYYGKGNEFIKDFKSIFNENFLCFDVIKNFISTSFY